MLERWKRITVGWRAARYRRRLPNFLQRCLALRNAMREAMIVSVANFSEQLTVRTIFVDRILLRLKHVFQSNEHLVLLDVELIVTEPRLIDLLDPRRGHISVLFAVHFGPLAD